MELKLLNSHLPFLPFPSFMTDILRLQVNINYGNGRWDGGLILKMLNSGVVIVVIRLFYVFD